MQPTRPDITAARGVGPSSWTHSALARMLAETGDSPLTFLVGARLPEVVLQAARRSGFGAMLLDSWWDDGYRYHLVVVHGASEMEARRLGSRYRVVPVHVAKRDGRRVVSLLHRGAVSTEVGAWSDDAVLHALTAAAGCAQCVGIAYSRAGADLH